MNAIPAISVSRCWIYLNAQMNANAPYEYGVKPPLRLDLSHVSEGLDCSAETKQLIYYGTGGKLTIVDGSYNQKAWCDQMCLSVPDQVHRVQYRNIGDWGDGKLFMAFYSNADGIGHTWLVDGTKGESMESHGAKGPDNRAWDDPVLLRIVTSCYQLPCVP